LCIECAVRRMEHGVRFAAGAEPQGRPSQNHGSEGLVVHARKSEVESVISSEIQSRRTFCTRVQGGKRTTVLLEDPTEALSAGPKPGRRASLSAVLAKVCASAGCFPGAVPSPTQAQSPRPVPHGARGGDAADSDGSEEWDPSAVDEDQEARPLDLSSLSATLASLRLLQMKPHDLSEEERDLLLSLAQTAAEIVGSKVVTADKKGGGGKNGEETKIAQAPFAPQPRDKAVEPPKAAEVDKPKAKVVLEAKTDDQPEPAQGGNVAAKERTQSQPPPSVVSLEKAPTAFRHFLDARTVVDIEEGYRYLLQCAELLQEESGQKPTDKELPYTKFRRLPELPWKATKVWQLLDAQLKKDDHLAKPLQGKSVVVVGAGPVGLRIALQLALVGASVTVLEKRGEFVRINRLHLWDWVKQDLIQWGAKIFSPPGGSFGADKDYCHIGISELQYLLLKCCLLLGVNVELGVEFRDAVHTSEKGWVAVTEPSLVAPAELAVDALVCCDGAASRIAACRGGTSTAGGLGKEGQAIGVVANFVNGRSKTERDLRQFSWARQFNASLFKNLKDKVGADLQNIVYYRGDDSHYMIMTPSKQCLVEKGCLHTSEQLDGAPLLRPSNVEIENLKSLAQEVAQHFGLPTEFTPTQSVMAFDFSDTKRQDQALIFQEAPGEGQPLPISLAGDALLEPFWPTGLGCIRGFLGALDSVSCLSTWFSTGDREQAIRKAEAAYRALKSVDAQTKDMTLKPDGEWRIDPATRYRHM